MLETKNAVAVITGGGSGIGLSVARYWLGQGGKVVLADISEEALDAAKENLEGDVVTVPCDVTKEADNQKLAALAIETYGRIDLVAPFAGIIMDGLLVATDRETGKVKGKMSLEQFQRVVDINLTGVFLTVRECLEQMINNDCRGLICLVSSTGSLGTAGQINYSSTKAAMSVMPKVITAELFRRKLADRIRCVAIAPGYVRTPLVENMNAKALERILGDVPIGRLIDPEEIASLACEIFRNEALAGDVYFIHGGLRLGSRG
ncbi:MAG: SDR family NAD(P)-dependent oxidoreductase [Desulfobacterales bacterium]|nr:SDR family NAD(P)-dependent oxidoreductase [Desulfobacterales bacterium]